MAFYDNTGHGANSSSAAELTKHIQSIFAPHITSAPTASTGLLQSFYKSYENMHTMNLLETAKKQFLLLYILASSSIPSLEDYIWTSRDQSSRKTFIYDMQSIKMDIKKIRRKYHTSTTNQRFFSSVLYSTDSKKKKTVVQNLRQNVNSCVNRQWFFI